MVDRIVDGRDRLLLAYIRDQLIAQQKRLPEPIRQAESSETLVLGTSRQPVLPEMSFSVDPINKALENTKEIINSLTGVTSSLANLLTLFRSDYTLYPVFTTIDNNTLYAALAHFLTKSQRRVLPFPPLPTHDNEPSLLTLIADVVQRLTATSPNPHLPAILKNLENEVLKALLPAATPINQTTSSDQAQTNSKTESVLSRALLSEYLTHAERSTHQLTARVTSGGSDMIARKQLFSSGRLLFIGGCTIEYLLATADGSIIAADLVQSSEHITLDLNRNTISFKPLTDPKA
ncbi:MAG: hypothetical protein ACK44M_04685 [Chloroflexus sp.]